MTAKNNQSDVPERTLDPVEAQIARLAREAGELAGMPITSNPIDVAVKISTVVNSLLGALTAFSQVDRDIVTAAYEEGVDASRSSA